MQPLDPKDQSHREILKRIARRSLIDKGFEPEFNGAVQAEIAAVASYPQNPENLTDLRNLLWCSIDNDDSRDLDQLTVAEELPNGGTKVYVAIADVDSVVKYNTALDAHAHKNTTSIYTPGTVFPMLPERLSTDLTSLNYNEERAAIVVEMSFASDGRLSTYSHSRALVKNHAKLAYDSVAAWLDGTLPKLDAIERVPGLAAN